MPGTGRTFYIVGAGISGLTLALALAKFGATAIVLERSPALSEFGAGLQVSPNARRILDRLGLGESLAARSLEPAGIDIYPYRAATPLVTMQLGAAMRERFGVPYAVMHRADLADVLYKACRRFANIDILFGVRGWDAKSHARGVTVAIHEAGGLMRTGRGQGLIGADGVHSLTRRQMLGGPDARYHGRVARRTLVPEPAVRAHLALDRVSVLFGPGFHLVCYPLPHRRQVNMALFATAARETGETGATPDIRQRRNPSARITALLEAAGSTWTPWPLYTVAAPRWHRGNIGIIGDAAHAMVPFQAQGAAMAVEDAAVLATLLVTERDAESAFVRLEQLRRARVERVARLSRSNGTIFHMGWPLHLVRDLGIRLQGERGHLRRLAWLYAYDAQQELNHLASNPS